MDNSGSEMLKPFRIRDLRDDPNSLGRSGSGIRDGVVQVSAPDYDTTILKHPEATLMYMDDDDGEIISVSSSQPSPVFLYLTTRHRWDHPLSLVNA